MAKVRTTILLEEGLIYRLKKVALERKTTMTRLVEEALDSWLQRPQKSREQFRVRTHGKGGFLPGVDLADNVAVREILDRT